MDEKQLEVLRSMGEPMDALQQPRLLRAFIYGDFGVGKSDLTAKIVEAIGEPAIWLNTDSGWTTVLKTPEVAKRAWKIPFDSFAHTRLIVQAHTEGIEPFCNYKVLVWDTASTAIDLMLREQVRIKPKLGLSAGSNWDPALETKAHYRLVAAALKETVDVLKKSNMHIIYTAHIRNPSDEDKENKKFAIRPAGPEASYKVLAQEVNLLGWLYKDGGKRLIQFEPTLKETAKTQIPTIEEKIYPVNQVPELISKFINQ